MMALLEARNLVKTFINGRGGLFRRPPQFNAVDGVSLSLSAGETLAVVGESGCGKSTLGRMLVGLDRPDRGTVALAGTLLPLSYGTAWRATRQRMQMVFQDAAGSLDPRLPIFVQVREGLDVQGIGTRQQRRAATEAILDAVKLGRHLWDSVPGELSGGQQQRVVIARAAVLRPDVLVCDEPVSSLDVSIQAQVIALLDTVQREMGLTVVFISHDLAVVRHVASRVAVMYLGRVVEMGSTEDIFTAPRHPYTQALLAAVPIPEPTRRRPATLALGEPPSPAAPPSGCRFHPRCPHATAMCRTDTPILRQVDARAVACHHAEAIVPPQEIAA